MGMVLIICIIALTCVFTTNNGNNFSLPPIQSSAGLISPKEDCLVGSYEISPYSAFTDQLSIIFSKIAGHKSNPKIKVFLNKQSKWRLKLAYLSSNKKTASIADFSDMWPIDTNKQEYFLSSINIKKDSEQYPIILKKHYYRTLKDEERLIYSEYRESYMLGTETILYFSGASEKIDIEITKTVDKDNDSEFKDPDNALEAMRLELEKLINTCNLDQHLITIDEYRN